MELRHLNYFLILAKELNFNRAAEKLHISQPPLSRQIKQLEQELGAELFVRTNRKVTLTDAGKYFQKEISNIVNQLELVTLNTRKIGNSLSGAFRLAYIGSTYSTHITGLIGELSSTHPFVNCRLYEIGTTKQLNALEKGKLDLGIVRGPVFSANLSTKKWVSDSYSLIFNSSKVQIKKLEDFHSNPLPFIFYNRDYAPLYYQSLRQICVEMGFEPSISHESNHVNSILSLVKEGLGVTILPTAVTRQMSNELTSIQIDTRHQSEVLFVWSNKNNSPIIHQAIEWLIGVID
ncbi:MAG: LysR family transcriptional regulator [Cyclobacteriaceae bacterium]